MIIILLLPCGTANYYTSTWPSGRTQTSHLYVHMLQLWGYKPVINPPLQVLYGIRHWCVYNIHVHIALRLYVVTAIVRYVLHTSALFHTAFVEMY